MGVKPGYKLTEFGVLPEDWDVKPIIYFCEYADYRGKTPPKTQSGTFLVTARNVRKGFIDYVDSQEFVPTALYDQIMRRGRPRIGDVLITTEAPLGNVAQVDREDVALAQRIIKYRPRSEELSSTYLKHYFLSDRFQQILDDHSSGSTAKGIKGRVLHQLPVVFPPPPEQRTIAMALSDVDGLLGGLDRLIAKKRDLKQATMQQLLTGQTRLPGFHGEWEVKRLGDVGKCLRGVSYRGDSDLSTHDTIHTKRLLRSNNVQNAIVVTDDVQFVNAARVSSQQVLRKDDILVCMANGSKALVGKAGIFTVGDAYEYTFGAFMGCFRANSAKANPAFVFYLFLTGRYRDYINNLLAGSSINNLRPSSIESLEFSMPLLPEQTDIAEVLTEMDAELSVLEQQREKTRALKQAMMQELLTGRTRLV